MISACIDTNVYISALAFGGKPAKIIELALLKKFNLVISTHILSEMRRNLTAKLDFSEAEVSRLLKGIIDVSSVYEPTGSAIYIAHKQDNLVLETALLGKADILVTGDKKDLLPLKTFKGIIIEPPSAFLTRLETLGIL